MERAETMTLNEPMRVGGIAAQSGWNRFVRKIRQPAWWAFSSAILLHVVWLIISAFILVGKGGWGAGSGSGEPVEFAVMSESELAAGSTGGMPVGLPEVPEVVGATGGSQEPLSVGPVGVADDAGAFSDTGVLLVTGGAGDVAAGKFGSGGEGGGMGG